VSVCLAYRTVELKI